MIAGKHAIEEDMSGAIYNRIATGPFPRLGIIA